MPLYLSKANAAGDGAICGCAGCPVVDELTLTLSGIGDSGYCPCGGTGTELIALSGINAAHIITWSVDSWWLIGFGSYTLRTYSASDCTGTFSDFTGTLTIRVSCVDGLFTISVFGDGGSLFFSVIGATLSTAAPNEYVCGALAGVVTEDGMSTLEL